MLSINDVIASFGSQARSLRISILDADSEVPTVLIEGSSGDFRFLAQLLLSIADGGDPGFQFAPNGAGSVYFAHDSALGLYLHRRDLPKAI